MLGMALPNLANKKITLEVKRCQSRGTKKKQKRINKNNVWNINNAQEDKMKQWKGDFCTLLPNGLYPLRNLWPDNILIMNHTFEYELRYLY